MLKVITGLLIAAYVWALFTLNAHAGPLDFLDLSGKINQAENIMYAVGGALAMLAALYILRRAAIIISNHWRLCVGLAAVAVIVGVLL